MKRRIYLLDSEDRPSLVVARELILLNGHELVGPEDPPPPGIHPIVWASHCLAILPLTQIAYLHLGMCLGKGKTCLTICPGPDVASLETIRPYIPAERIFPGWPDLGRFLKFESEIPF